MITGAGSGNEPRAAGSPAGSGGSDPRSPEALAVGPMLRTVPLQVYSRDLVGAAEWGGARGHAA